MAMYDVVDYRTFKVDDEGQRFLLANFSAEIVQETRIFDGINTETILRIKGFAANPDNKHRPSELPETEVPAASYAGLTWVMNAWGVRAVIQPGTGVKEDLRTAIQLRSRPKVVTIYKHIGWTKINGEDAYLHSGGAITAKGNNPNVTVRLPVELSRYNLTGKGDLGEAFHAALELTKLAPADVAWTLWTATFAPLYGPVDFATHLTGRSGTFKSELVSLFQSFYGSGMDARHLPGSWSSTANALEAQAFFAANAPFVIDDFVPIGTSWQVRTYQTTADKIIRAQGNQAGRARLTDTSGLQQTYYPRGLIISTGEDTPEGHSVRARMMIIELSPGDIKPEKLTEAQTHRPLYPVVTAALAQDLCGNMIVFQDRADKIRNRNLDLGHTRTPPMVARLVVTGYMVLEWALQRKLIDAKRKKNLVEELEEAICKVAQQQTRYLETADPVEIFFAGLRQLLGAGHGHVRTLNGGIPLRAPSLGWTEEKSSGELPTYKSHGPCVGWINWNEDELYLEINIGYTAVKKIVGQELTLTKQTLFKRLKDAGMLTRIDEARQRNTVRITAENHPRQVLAFSASSALESAERPTEDDGF